MSKPNTEQVLKLIQRIQFVARNHFKITKTEDLEDLTQSVLLLLLKAKQITVPEFKIKYLIIDYIRSLNHHRRDCALPEFVEFLPDHHDIDESLEQRCIERLDAQSLVKRITPQLTPRESDVFSEMYLKNQNNIDSARALGVSPEYACQTHKTILGKLRGLA
jgi:DNA-directed RNA polymerase specialized sigma24 family protein